MLHSGYRAGSMTGGPECEQLERDLERYYDVPHARVFNSGTSALYAALIAMGARQGYTVTCPVYTMSASAAAILHAGAYLHFADIGDDYCLAEPGPDITMLVHLFGHHKVAGWPGRTVHDCAQSPSLRPDPHRPTDLWAYSLNQHKVVECGEGGYVLTYSTRLADRLHAVRNHGEVTTPDILGWNLRMTEMQATIAREQFALLDVRLDSRRLWAEDLQHTYALPPDPGNTDWFLYPVRVKDGDRTALAAELGGRVGYHRLLTDLPWFEAHGYQGDFPTARRIESELVVVDPLVRKREAA